MLSIQDCAFSAADLERFKAAQRLSFDILERTAASLQAGESERAVGKRIHKQMKQAGASYYFHGPAVMFGERTSYPGDFGPFGALPTERTLKAGDAVTLDCAPVFDGYTVDTSFCTTFDGTGVPVELDRFLIELRESIRQRVERRLTTREIARQVDAQIRERGMENCHRKHIGMVLGHRVLKENSPSLRGLSVWGLSPRQLAYTLVRSVQARRGRRTLSPIWNHTRQSDCPVPDGLWAVEPHVAKDGIGAKFEDILVVQDGAVYYLDDDLPHHRRWRAAGLI